MTSQLRRTDPDDVEEILADQESDLADAAETVEPVVRDVEREGDDALIRYTAEFDEFELDDIAVTPGDVEDAYDAVEDDVVEALRAAAGNVAAFHSDQLPDDLSLSNYLPGVQLGHKSTPIESAGCYVPGGRAAYPSSAIMTVVPARVAGVERVVACSPPPIAPETVVAADVAGADALYRGGGAQAVAALAHGTETVESVDKVVGPGGVYVTAAKSLVRGEVEIDFLAGPSEVLIVADDSADSDRVALDVAAQAEHGPDSLAILVTTDLALIEEVETRLAELLEESGRSDLLESSLDRSVAVAVDTVEEAVEVSNRVAPEHLEVLVRDELGALDDVRHAGAVFLGPDTPVAAGDYATGANHVLPTAGAASRVSGLDTSHFLKRTTVQRLDREGLETLAPIVERLGTVEGLDMHVRSVTERLNEHD